MWLSLRVFVYIYAKASFHEKMPVHSYISRYLDMCTFAACMYMHVMHQEAWSQKCENWSYSKEIAKLLQFVFEIIYESVSTLSWEHESIYLRWKVHVAEMCHQKRLPLCLILPKLMQSVQSTFKQISARNYGHGLVTWYPHLSSSWLPGFEWSVCGSDLPHSFFTLTWLHLSTLQDPWARREWQPLLHLLSRRDHGHQEALLLLPNHSQTAVPKIHSKRVSRVWDARKTGKKPMDSSPLAYGPVDPSWMS